MKRWACLAILALAACSSKDIVVVYSPHGADILKDYEALFEAQYPEIDMQWLDMGSQDVYNRVYAERNRPACDIWWGGPSTMYMQAVSQDLLASYQPTWSGAIQEDNYDAAHRWYGTHSTPLCIMFNNKKYIRETVPQTWDDLLNPTWDKHITMRAPLESGTMRTFINAMIWRAPNEDAGIEWLRKLHKATEGYMENPQLLFDRIKRNEELLTVWIMPDAVLQRDRHGYPFDFHVPPQTPLLTEGIAIVEGAPHRAWAEKFYEFVTTKEALAHQAEVYGKIPARTDIEPASLPQWMVEQEIEPMDIDWNAFSEKGPAWVERWQREVYQAQ